MARSIQVIKQQLIDAKNANATLVTLNSPSQVAVWNLWLFIFAVGVNIFEQFLDLYVAQTQAIANIAPPGTQAWVRNQVLNVFQYDSVTPQIINLQPDFTLNYAVVDPTKRIVSQCAVITDINKKVNIMVAKQNPPTALLPAELSALQGFISGIEPAGIQAVAISLLPDYLYVQGDIYFNGQYANVILANVITAINTFLFNIPFTGVVKMSDLENAIRTVPGVNDVQLTNVKARPSTALFSAATPLITGSQIINRQWATVAGYIIQENTTGNTFADKLNMLVG